MTPIDALLHGCYTKAPKRIRGLLAYSTFCLQSARFDLWACLDSNQGPLPYQFRSVLPPPRPARPAGPENGLDRAKTPGPGRPLFRHLRCIRRGCSTVAVHRASQSGSPGVAPLANRVGEALAHRQRTPGVSLHRNGIARICGHPLSSGFPLSVQPQPRQRGCRSCRYFEATPLLRGTAPRPTYQRADVVVDALGTVLAVRAYRPC